MISKPIGVVAVVAAGVRSGSTRSATSSATLSSGASVSSNSGVGRPLAMPNTPPTTLSGHHLAAVPAWIQWSVRHVPAGPPVRRRYAEGCQRSPKIGIRGFYQRPVRGAGGVRTHDL